MLFSEVFGNVKQGEKKRRLFTRPFPNSLLNGFPAYSHIRLITPESDRCHEGSRKKIKLAPLLIDFVLKTYK